MRVLLPFLCAAVLQAADVQPQLAAAHGQVALAYGSGSAIWFTSSADGGKTFGPKVKVAEANSLALGRHRGPRVTILPDALLITAVVGDLTAWRSTDAGKTWVRTGLINDVPGAANEGLHAIAADAKGNLFAAWLDHRAKGTQLYGASSTDGGRTWAKNVLIYASPDGTICQCCDPSVAFDERGQVHVMFRNALSGSRDLYLAESTDALHFSAAQKLGEGTWKLDACPMDGGGLAVDRGQLITAWRRGSEIFIDRPGTPETSLGDGKDVSITASSKGTYVIWSARSGIELLAPGGEAPVKVAPEGAYPNIVGLPDGSALAAWEQDGNIKTAKLP
jgi:hypothetical protein